jgi:hypothetical protein
MKKNGGWIEIKDEEGRRMDKNKGGRPDGRKEEKEWKGRMDKRKGDTKKKV